MTDIDPNQPDDDEVPDVNVTDPVDPDEEPDED